MATMLIDGDCGLCTRLAAFSASRVVGEPFARVAIQSDAARVLLGQAYEEVIGRDEVTVLEGDRTLGGADAVLYVLARLRAPWRWLVVLRLIPRPVRDATYRFVARHRSLFGLTTCGLDEPGVDEASP